MPVHSTYRRIMAHKVYVEEIERMVGEYNEKGEQGEVYAMDGKTIRGMRIKEETGTEYLLSVYDVDAINEAQKPFLLALSPRVAANLALQTAEAIDSEIEDTSDELVEKIIEAKVQFKFERNGHREYHLKEIDEALKK